MKLFCIALTVIATVSADVSHLNLSQHYHHHHHDQAFQHVYLPPPQNSYLPPAQNVPAQQNFEVQQNVAARSDFPGQQAAQQTVEQQPASQDVQNLPVPSFFSNYQSQQVEQPQQLQQQPEQTLQSEEPQAQVETRGSEQATDVNGQENLAAQPFAELKQKLPLPTFMEFLQQLRSQLEAQVAPPPGVQYFPPRAELVVNAPEEPSEATQGAPVEQQQTLEVQPTFPTQTFQQTYSSPQQTFQVRFQSANSESPASQSSLSQLNFFLPNQAQVSASPVFQQSVAPSYLPPAPEQAQQQMSTFTSAAPQPTTTSFQNSAQPFQATQQRSSFGQTAFVATGGVFPPAQAAPETRFASPAPSVPVAPTAPASPSLAPTTQAYLPPASTAPAFPTVVFNQRFAQPEPTQPAAAPAQPTPPPAQPAYYNTPATPQKFESAPAQTFSFNNQFVQQAASPAPAPTSVELPQREYLPPTPQTAQPVTEVRESQPNVQNSPQNFRKAASGVAMQQHFSAGQEFVPRSNFEENKAPAPQYLPPAQPQPPQQPAQQQFPAQPEPQKTTFSLDTRAQFSDSAPVGPPRQPQQNQQFQVSQFAPQFQSKPETPKSFVSQPQPALNVQEPNFAAPQQQQVSQFAPQLQPPTGKAYQSQAQTQVGSAPQFVPQLNVLRHNVPEVQSQQRPVPPPQPQFEQQAQPQQHFAPAPSVQPAQPQQHFAPAPNVKAAPTQQYVPPAQPQPHFASAPSAQPAQPQQHFAVQQQFAPQVQSRFTAPQQNVAETPKVQPQQAQQNLQAPLQFQPQLQAPAQTLPQASPQPHSTQAAAPVAPQAPQTQTFQFQQFHQQPQFVAQSQVQSRTAFPSPVPTILPQNFPTPAPVTPQQAESQPSHTLSNNGYNYKNPAATAH